MHEEFTEYSSGNIQGLRAPIIEYLSNPDMTDLT